MPHKKKVLLLNPPADQKKIIKDQYCSFTSKGDYYWIPIDLLILSGDIGANFDVNVLDAVVEDISEEDVLDKISSLRPDHIVLLSSLLTHDIDRNLVNKARDLGLKFKTTFIGDIFYFEYRKMISFKEVDSIIYEYPAPELIDYISDEKPASNVIYKDLGGEIVETPKRTGKYVKYSIPLHEKFPLSKYTVPFMVGEKISSILTNFGCTFTCNYCPASSVNFRQRSTEDFEAELRYLLGINVNNLWIRDFTFGLDAKETTSILTVLQKYDFTWFGLTRSERITESLLKELYASGCYLLMIGIDTISDKSMGAVKRSQEVEELKNSIDLVSEYKIQALVHLILGLPGETPREMLKSIHFCASTKASFLSVNFFSKRSGSAYFDDASIDSQDKRSLDSLSAENGDEGSFFLFMFKLYALLTFYLRPSRVVRILSNTKTRKQLGFIVRTGFFQFFKT